MPSFVWTALASLVFVVLWSSAFIAAKAGLPYAEPLTFLSVRFAIVTVAMLIAALLVRAAWPKGVMIAHLAMVGLGTCVAVASGELEVPAQWLV